ncbi:RelA/SpoT domain-containing protein [Colwellia echini]|jgi:ppGpp synthetase/RelA/SpoT-type nucleotidyltranferase|uniref:RelA/SpoT domain-containing protein n=1 Tax=Colwellia echini TaxID=1982103 RepID=A0ABY3N015_9GAMM|nr:RelA/SpoT domain-containing protein [Colwellia echini]TYK66669.1 RelA/SpoT domain-containing protein [Colwellia echini]
MSNQVAVKPKYSGKQVIKAGEILIADDISEDMPKFSEMMDILSYWRFSHEEPLEKALEIIQENSKKFDKKTICAKRLKRHFSIVNKLRRFDYMKLKNMQDIAGCRAIVSSLKKLRKIERELKKKKEFRIKEGLPKFKDYIANPKHDGYRGLHLIGKFPDIYGTSKLVEVQVRTITQHYWATALEIVDLFTKQSLKTNQGENVWKDFFKDMGTIFEVIDSIHRFNDISHQAQFDRLFEEIVLTSNVQRKKELTVCCKRIVQSCKNLKVNEKLVAYTGSLKIVDDRLENEKVEGYVLLKIELNKFRVQSILHADNESAAREYILLEKQAARNDDLVVAMVYSDAVGGIKDAYPNYFADSTVFLRYLGFVRRIYQLSNDEKSVSTGFLKRIFRIN